MENKLKKLGEPLDISYVDFRVKSVSPKGWVQVLAYKDARVDMKRLDDVVGPMNWKREHTRDNHNCIVSIYDSENKQWVSKEDVGQPSKTEGAKGVASDSFKRACVNWGIGRELYGYPSMWIKLNDNEIDKVQGKVTFDFKLDQWKWAVKYGENNEILGLAAKDEEGNKRWGFGIYN